MHPRWTDPRNALWSALFLVCAVAPVPPLWSVQHPPIQDYPEHVATIATLRHFWDPAWHCQDTFVLTLHRTPYVLYHLAGALLSIPLGSAERANLFLLSLVAVAFPYATRSLLRVLGRDERLALFAAPLFWSRSLLLGFLPYLAALPVSMWALALLVREAEAPKLRRSVVLGAVAVALVLTHLSVAVLFFACATAVCAAFARPWRRLPRVVAALAPAAALVAAPWLGDLLFDARVRGKPIVEFRSMSDSFAKAPLVTDIWQGWEDEAYTLLLVVAALALAWPRRHDPLTSEPDAAQSQRGVFAAFVLVSLGLYFATPNRVGSLFFLGERFAVPAALFSVGLLRPPRGARSAVPLLVVGGIAMVASGVAFAKFRAFEREAGGFELALAQIPPGRRLLGLIYEPRSTVAHEEVFMHFAQYYRARGPGSAEVSFSLLPHWPIQYRPDAAPPKKDPLWESRPDEYDNRIDGAYYDFILAHGNTDPTRRSTGGPRWEKRAYGSWFVYAKTGADASPSE